MGMRIEFEPLDNLLKGTSDFRPFAYYDKHLDAIRVQIVDGSICEERLDPILTICRANEWNDEVVGFAIKGVSHLLDGLGIKPSGAIQLTKLLDALVKTYPSYSTKFVLEIFGSWPATKPQEVEYARAA